MVSIEKDKFGTEYFTVGDNRIGQADHHDFTFILDRDSAMIYSDDTCRYFTLEEISEFVEYLEKDKEKRGN